MASTFKNIFVLIICIIMLGSCSGLKGYSKAAATDYNNLKAPLWGDYNRVLYKTQMDAFGKHFSGINLFKPIPEDTSYRMVMLSEFGLNLLDLSFNKSGTKIVSCQSFLNRPVILNLIEKTSRLLLFIPEGNKKTKKYENKKTGQFVIKFKNSPDKYFYFYNKQGLLNRIVHRSGLFNKLSVNMDYDSTNMPSSIKFTNSPVKYSMKLMFLNIEK